MSDCITTDSLSKNFGSVRAVHGVSLHVKTGEIYGFLGLNGAGKTTTIRMLLGMMKQSSGEAYLFGKKVDRKDSGTWSRVGYLVEIPYSYGELTVRENLEVVRRLRSVDNFRCVDEIMDKLRLSEYADRRAKNLSLGNAQRLGLAKALIHDPELLILDEPANGLDPEGIVEIRELLKRLAAENGVTIFISSHILGEVSKFADRIGIIHKGELIRELGTGDLEGELHRRLLVSTTDNAKAISVLKERGFSVSSGDDGTLSLEDRESISTPERVASMIVGAGCGLSMIRVDEEDLESYFLRIVGAGKGR